MGLSDRGTTGGFTHNHGATCRPRCCQPYQVAHHRGVGGKARRLLSSPRGVCLHRRAWKHACCQPASTPTHTLLAYFHLNIGRPQTTPLPLTAEHTAGGLQVHSVHLLAQTFKFIGILFSTGRRRHSNATCVKSTQKPYFKGTLGLAGFLGYGSMYRLVKLLLLWPCLLSLSSFCVRSRS